MKKIARSLGTHDGTFHADEVTASALLLFYDLIDKDKIIRTRNTENLAQCEYVCDVGGVLDPKSCRFDHHQRDYRGSKSSAGLVLEYLIAQGVISEEFGSFLDEEFIRGVDAHDNGKVLCPEGVMTFSHIVAQMVPVDYACTAEQSNRAFLQAVDWVYGVIARIKAKYDYRISCCELVHLAMKSSLASKDPKLLIFDQNLPWLENFFALGGKTHPAQFVLMPSGQHWKLRGIPPHLGDKMSVRTPLPANWAGLLAEDLEKASGISGGIFCHKGRFISVWATKDAALRAYSSCI